MGNYSMFSQHSKSQTTATATAKSSLQNSEKELNFSNISAFELETPTNQKYYDSNKENGR